MGWVMENVMVAKSMPVRADRRDTTYARSQPPLPNWVQQVRPGQARAVREVVDRFASGALVVFLDAPTGTGKSLLAELVRRELEVTRGLYVATTKHLQDQLLADFPYARVLKGRGNYTPTKIGTSPRHQRTSLDVVSCQDCDRGPVEVAPSEQSCSFCWAVDECPYTIARQEALRAPVGVLNTAFLLAHCNRVKAREGETFHGRELVVLDEGDLLEEQLMGYVELRLGKRLLDTLGLEVPKKGSHMTTIRAWLDGEVRDAVDIKIKAMRGQGGVEAGRTRRRLEEVQADIARMVAREDGWVREGDEEGDRSPDALVLKPVSVEDVGVRYLWRHGARFLVMSGTTLSAQMQADVLGLEAGDQPIHWEEVRVPMTFARESRRVVYAPLGEMTRKGQEAGATAKVLEGVGRVVERHPGVNVLIHTHTYKLAQEVVGYLKPKTTLTGRRAIITYTKSWDKDRALAVFKQAAGTEDKPGRGAILVASSMDRGVDLPGDLCRVQIVVKVPMASLGSRQVSERLRAPGGQLWYLAGTARGLVQMTGRAVRGEDDWAVTYVLDQHFGRVLREGKRYGLFPEWWLDALEVGRV